MSIVVLGAGTSAKEVAYKLDEHGRILVPVMFGERVYHYLLSTSARRIGVRKGDFKALKIKQYENSVLEDFSIKGEIQLPMAGLTEMSLAERFIRNRYITVLQAKSTVDGVLGYAAFGEQLVYIKPSSSIIGFHSHAAAFSNDGWALIDGFNNKYGGIVIETDYNGILLNILFASGLSRSVLDNRAYEALKHVLPPRKKKNGFTQLVRGADGNTNVFQKQILPKLAIGNLLLGDVEVVTTKVNVAEAANNNDALLLILGADVIAQHELVLDFRDHQVWYPLISSSTQSP